MDVFQSNDTTTRDLEQLTIYSPSKKVHVPLKQVAHFQKALGPQEIYRHNQERTITLSVDASSSSLELVSQNIRQLIADKYNDTQGTRLLLLGEDQQRRESFNNLVFVFCLSIIFIYMIMASQFQSYIQPILILVVIPLSLSGVLLTLIILGQSLNVMSGLGAIMLSGIVVNHGILLMEFFNQYQDSYSSKFEAMINALRARGRPIAMSATTTIFGLIPLICSSQTGAQMQSPMASAVIGGLFCSIFVTLLILPALCVLFKK